MDFRQFSSLIMIEQTFFSLPFALIGVLFAGGGTLNIWIWVIIAIAAARTAGMAFNRVIDAKIDAKNPRTRDRLIPKGEVRASTVWLTAVLASLILVFASLMLNRLCFYLSFFAIVALFTYSYFKRFSYSSHLYLGFVEAAAPIGGYLAVTGEFSLLCFILGFVIMMWITGLDIIYAIQDMGFDVKENLHSIPVRLGKEKALFISAVCYLFSVIALIIAGARTDMGTPYWIGIICVSSIFTYQQMLARSEDIEAGIRKLFGVNKYVSPILFLGAFIDVFS